MRLLHVVTGLAVGGAEYALLRLTTGLERLDVANHVLCLNAGGPVAESFERAGIPLTVLNVSKAPFQALARARGVVRSFCPDLIQGWMYHGNLAASVLNALTRPKKPVIWNVRHSVADIGAENRPTRRVIRAGTLSLWQPRCVVYNSGIAREQHRRLGYARHADVVIANGVDTSRFKPDAEARAAWRQGLQFSEPNFVVGLVARYHESKDCENFLSAAKRLEERFDGVRFVMVGPGMTSSNAALLRLIETRNLRHTVHLLGPVAALENVYPGLDTLALSSYGEGLPNVILEAMACGVPAVSTAVGDAPDAVLDERFVARPRDPDSLAERIAALAGATPAARQELGISCRAHVSERFDEARCTEEFLHLYQRVLGG